MKKIFAAMLFVGAALCFVMAEGKGETAPSMMASSDTNKNFFDVGGLGASVALFAGEKQAQALAEKNTVVYFFAATWCPTCRGTYKDVVADYRKIPSDYRLIFVNYDTEKELKAKYGVTYQHTFVSIDARGKAKKVWSGSAGVEEILKETE